ncbi:helix-turn-helix domain-containing protein [Leptospira yanagawae]|uniref:Helix-turn-helix domain-containing protein n=1 Tax=Leptospira yanagawae TaxID=293069 RepID=A0ABY2M3K8_9LEPT|nr:GyrI-like domain-containing protein [Leptospira yanagawae]TGL20072.1 helix-turn-helix domain-containing protein [Leptospira yanagawae]
MPKKTNLYPVWNQLESKLQKPIGLNQIAFFTGYSDWHFHRVFKSIQGENLKQYTRRLRLEKAAYELKITKFPVIEIALEAGFQSQEAFTKAFKRVLGLTPSEFRKRYQKQKKNSKSNFLTLPEGVSKHGFQMKTISSFSIVYVRHIGNYEELPGPILEAKEVKQIQTLLVQWNSSWTKHKWIGICQDDPEISPKGKIRFDLGITMGPIPKPLPSGFGLQTITGGRYLQIRYQGKYESLPNIYDWILNEYFTNNAIQLRNLPPWECYLNPFEINDGKRITDIYLPIQ